MAFFKKIEVDKWDAAIGQQIKKAREAANLTQAQLAELVYKSQGNISDYEAGRHRISGIDLMLIAHATEQPPEFFVPHPFYASRKLSELSPKQRRLIHFIQKIGDDERMDKVTDMLIAQAKRLSDLMIDSDVEVMREQAREDLAKIRKQRKFKFIERA